MLRYLSVERIPVAISCYKCGAGIAFVNYDNINKSTCPECLTPLFLPPNSGIASNKSELGIVCPGLLKRSRAYSHNNRWPA